MSINKNNLKKLSEIAFEVTQNSKTEHPFLENTMIFLKPVIIIASVVIKNFLIQKKNLNLLQGGQVFMIKLMIRQFVT